MNLRFRAVLFVIAAVFCTAMLAQAPPPADPDFKLPNGKSQREEILRADHEKSLEDAAELMKLTEELKIELEKNDRHIVAVSTLKKLETIEKLTRRIRSRLKRF